MARTNQLSKEKRQSIITLGTGPVSLENCKNIKCVPSVVAKTIKRYDETGSHEDHPRKGRPRVISAAEDKFIWVTSLRYGKLTAPHIRAQMNTTQSSSSRHISTSTVQRRLCESGLYGQIAAKKTLLSKINMQKRFVWAKKHKEWTLDRWKSVLWSEIWALWFHWPCLCCVTQKRCCNEWYLHAWFPMWGMEEEVWWCGAALQVTLFITGIYSKLKAHWTSMATTAFYCDVSSHAVCVLMDHHLFFNRTMTPNTPPGCVRAIWPRRRNKQNFLNVKQK